MRGFARAALAVGLSHRGTVWPNSGVEQRHADHDLGGGVRSQDFGAFKQAQTPGSGYLVRAATTGPYIATTHRGLIVKLFIRTALLGAAGLVLLALPAHAQRPYDPSAGSVGFKKSKKKKAKK
jgi:hypothetical protein